MPLYLTDASPNPGEGGETVTGRNEASRDLGVTFGKTMQRLKTGELPGRFSNPFP